MSTASAATDLASSKAIDALDFGFSPAVSAKVRREWVDSLAKSSRQPPETIRAAIGDRDFIAEFALRFAPLGLRADNFADAMTAYWVSMWSLIHRTELPPISAFAAARLQLAAMWHKNPYVKREGDRQTMAEVMIYETMLALEERDRKLAAGDEQALQALSENSARNMQSKRGVNLKAMQLTESGFTRMTKH